ncbi:hypothetical protein OJF2_18360 [Aquisphaera giovannonii]|uniref:Uncharacterized protein n=1 Tax=Aquisphaera giovannonii TaxID=406548 RepID=A0A5B9VZX3_9BACT|nr:hypothetical protein [Aquisphaera giovannonii]QEH33335.1 hypothetical protein OJF2_18360 [Aquisphaera giovannonii]
MNAIAISMLAALTGLGDGPAAAPQPRPSAAVAPGAAPKAISFEIREIAVASPEWRGKLMPNLNPVGRQEAATAWMVDAAGFKQWLEDCQADTRCNVLQAPRMIVRVGEPARMTNEEAHKYVASLKRVADAAPGKASQIAFQPQVEEVHNGVRVNILSSQVRDGRVFAQVSVEENRLLGIYTTNYKETVAPRPGEDPGVVRASFVDRIMPNHGPQPAAIAATIQVPEVDSRRIDGRWMIPAEGALLVSMGPRPSHEKSLRKGYSERLVAITARPTNEEPEKPSSSFPEGAKDRVRTVIPARNDLPKPSSPR